MAKINLDLGKMSMKMSDKVSFPIMVCSHERSGTHFLMNALSNCTHYTSPNIS